MKSFAEMLSVGVVGRPVVDMTGLTGAYEVAVDISMDDAMNRPNFDHASAYRGWRR